MPWWVPCTRASKLVAFRDDNRALRTGIAVDSLKRNVGGAPERQRFVLVTCEPDAVVGAVHTRMPLSLTAPEALAWLNGAADARALLDQMNRYRAFADELFWREGITPDQEELVCALIRNMALECYREWVRAGKVVPVEDAAQLLGSMTLHRRGSSHSRRRTRP